MNKAEKVLENLSQYSESEHHPDYKPNPGGAHVYSQKHHGGIRLHDHNNSTLGYFKSEDEAKSYIKRNGYSSYKYHAAK